MTQFLQNSRRSCVALLLCFSLLAESKSTATAADFELVNTFGVVTGVATLGRGELFVQESNGNRWRYTREPRYDTVDGFYAGYFNLELNRLIRFPRSGVGMILRADLDHPVARFVPASVSVQPIGSGGFLGSQPILGGYGAVPLGRPAYFPGYRSRSLSMGIYPVGPRAGLPSRYGPVAPVAPVQSVLVESKVVSGPPLSPVEVRLINRHVNELRVTLVDLIDDSQTRSFRIPAGGQQAVLLQREASPRRVAQYQTYDVVGAPVNREVVSQLPAPVRYEVVVHERKLQSIAIDRTGKSPNVIEDANFQGRGLGRFTLPPGESLKSGLLDVYEVVMSSTKP